MSKGRVSKPGGWTLRDQVSFVLALATLSARLTVAAPNHNAAAISAPFSITHLAYATNGQLGDLPQPARQVVNSFYYGAPVTNAVFASRLPIPASAQDRATSSGRNPPARPDRPLYRIDRWDREQGLPANKVNALLQSRDGYLWIGTVGGVARFDGMRFTVFTSANTPAMETNGVVGRAMFEDDKGWIWIATERGMLCHANGRFVAFAGQDALRGHDIRCFARRSAGGFWFGANDRVGYWDGSAIQWHLTIKSENESWNRVLSLAEDSDGALWIGTVGRLWRAERATGVPSQVRLAGTAPVAIHGLFLSKRQTLWIGSGHGVWRLPRGTAEPEPIGGQVPPARSLPHAASFAEDVEGRIWATTGLGEGLFQLNEEGTGIVTTSLATELHETLCILVDREGVVWIGARDLGLIRLRPQHLATVAFGSRGILDHVRSISEGRDGSLWFASRPGFGNWAGRNIILAETRQLGAQRTSPVFVLPSGAVWTSFPTAGLFEPLASGGDPRRLLPAIPFLRELGEVQAMAARRDGSIWIGTTNGLFQVNGSSAPEKIPGLSHPEIRALLEDKQGRLWIGTAGGLECLGDDGKDARAQANRVGVSGESVSALHESDDGRLWIGTEAGLRQLRDGRVALFTSGSGLPQQAIHCILEDDSGRLWLSHAAGIARAARSELESWLQDSSRRPAVAEFGSADGILNPEMSGGSQPNGLKAADGRLWFPNRNGMIVVDPSRCPDSPAPRVLIEKIVADGRPLPLDTTAELAPGTAENLEVRFTATSLHSPERVRFRYQLVGHDRDWRDAGEMRRASYANLGPGRYEFRVQACNHEGRWSERDAIAGFRLAPHFWQTWLFRAAGGLATAGFVGCFVALRLRNQHRRLEAERVRGLELERRRIARDMHDHLGAQLAGIALASGANESAHQRVRESLRELNDLIWAVHPDNDTLPSLADFIANFASRYLGAAGIELDLDLPEQIPATPIPSRLRHELAAMFKEALRNVTQHAKAKRASVRLRIDAGRLALSVRDDGCGFVTTDPGASPSAAASGDNSPPHPSGNGLRNFRLRSESLGGTCHIHSAPGHGTTVEFQVPLNTKDSDER